MSKEKTESSPAHGVHKKRHKETDMTAETIVPPLQEDLNTIEGLIRGAKKISRRRRTRIMHTFESRVKRRPRVQYVAIGGKRKPSVLMQPKVREVYEALDNGGPATMLDLEGSLVGMDRNTLRFAIQVLRQAGMVDSERP